MRYMLYFILMVCAFQLKAQDLSQKVTLSYQQTTLEQVLEDIRKRYDVQFSYSRDRIQMDVPITLQAVALPLRQALDEIFKQSSIKYQVISGQLTLTKSMSITNTDLTLSGRVMSTKGSEPISFVNIGFLGSHVGTISNMDGTWSISIPPSLQKEKLLFSALGYERVYLHVDSIRDLHVVDVFLTETVTQLKTVTVSGRKMNHRIQLGNNKYEGGSVYADTVMAGSAMALLIDRKELEFPVFVDDAALRITHNTFSEFKVRVRFYSVDSVTRMPGKDLVGKSIVQASRMRNGWLRMDLRRYDIVIEEPFFLTFEWILEKKDRAFLHRQFEGWRKKHPNKVTTDVSVVDGKPIPYANYNSKFWAGTSFGIAVSPDILEAHKCYIRYSSFSKWQRSSSILTANITLSN